MPQQTTPDKNFFNISGDDTGNIWVNDVLTFAADQPGMRELRYSDITAPSGQGIADCLKLSGLRRIRVYVDILDGRGAAEDAVDINHCEDYELVVGTLYPGRRYCGTIKGASARGRVMVGRQVGHGAEVDWDYGNHANGRQGYTRGQGLSVSAEGAEVVTVRCIMADPVELHGGPYRYRFPSPLRWYHRFTANLFSRLLYRFL